MKVHHLNCGTMRPFTAQQRAGNTSLKDRPGRLICHVLLVEMPDRLLLVDSGFGLKVAQNPDYYFRRAFLWLAKPALDFKETAIEQIKALGHDPKDVRDIVLTHMHSDHAAGILDFPWAKVHVHADELSATCIPRGLERVRYDQRLWEHHPTFIDYQGIGDIWNGFNGVHAIKNTQDNLLLVPLPGHSRGHCGVAVKIAENWLLHSGDAYYSVDEMKIDQPSCPLPLRILQRAFAIDNQARLNTQQHLRRLAQCHDIRVISAADVAEWLSVKNE